MPRKRYQELKIERSKTKRPYYFVRYRADVVVENGDCVRKQRSRLLGYCAQMSLAEAGRKRDEVKREVNQLALGEIHAVPLGAFADQWLKRVRPTLSAGTANKYASHLPRINRTFGSWAMSELDSYTLETWLNGLEREDGRPLAWNTRADIRNLVSSIYATAQRWWPGAGLLNPAQGVKLGRKREVYDRKRLPSRKELQLLVGGLPLVPRLLLVTCDLLGLRITEALGLQEKHLDLIGGRISIEQKWYRGELGPTKTARGERVLPLIDLTSAYAQLATGDPEAFVFDRGKGADGAGVELVGEPFDDREIQKRWRKAARAAGVYWEGHGARTYRRKALTEMQSSGASAIEAMLLAGHSRPDMTAHYSQSLESRAAEIIGKRRAQG